MRALLESATLTIVIFSVVAYGVAFFDNVGNGFGLWGIGTLMDGMKVMASAIVGSLGTLYLEKGLSFSAAGHAALITPFVTMFLILLPFTLHDHRKTGG